ncbi:MAG: hypothetical protein LBI48_09485 [Burkholderiaceae bacterium]|jgi:hypothetical protein|nr:hypothetical protein [Burkholderiaceae bacterium]
MKTSPQAHQGMDELGGISGASAADAQPDDEFGEADLLAGNAGLGLGPEEVHEPEGSLGQAAPRMARAA